MDIVTAVESVRSYKEDITSSIDMASALREIAEIRARKEHAWKKYDAVHDQICSIGLVSNVYGSTGKVQTSGRRQTRQELHEENADRLKSIQKDTALLCDAIELIEERVKAIPDYDTRTIIQYKYINGWSDAELEELFGESEPGYIKKVERHYFRSLKGRN